MTTMTEMRMRDEQQNWFEGQLCQRCAGAGGC